MPGAIGTQHIVNASVQVSSVGRAQKSPEKPLSTSRHGRRVAFIPFLTAGDPDMDTTAEALRRVDQIGATVIELGVPYSVRDGRLLPHAPPRAVLPAIRLRAALEGTGYTDEAGLRQHQMLLMSQPTCASE